MNIFFRRFAPVVAAVGFVVASTFAVDSALVRGAEEFIPRRQTKPPNKPYTPEEAIARMTLPEGFSVELVAAEPDIVNPVAMTFDERGRIWITESLEYPRRAPGKGQDRVKVLEDTDGDGRAETVKVFAEGLNIPSGIAVGHGGVWVANAPDILFYPDADGNAVADGPPQVVVTGFGRDDTHELPNSLTWGPDCYLYGLNGVFNPSHVEQNGKRFDFTCAMFRIHPRTREFSLFCEGTSNPWGIAFNENGDAFISACVIDHLWHLTETGYYHRQGGPYPPHTWKLESIVDYKHQMAAYCGITWFDGDAYPERYRKKLYMGNIHGGCINVDRLERNGATYRGRPEPDFLTANDVWFMPVVQKTGPDGCLYILDWYDRYHCYQDANYDPKGVDRLKGRLYRVRFRNTPRAPKFDLAKETDDRLIERLGSPNVFYREIAQRILTERSSSEAKAKLEELVAEPAEGDSRERRLRALWTLVGMGSLDADLATTLGNDADPTIRAWVVRALGNAGEKTEANRKSLAKAADDPSADVRLQAAIAAPKLADDGGVATLFTVVENDTAGITPNIVWQNLSGALEKKRAEVLKRFSDARAPSREVQRMLWPRVVQWTLDRGDAGVEEVAEFIAASLSERSGDVNATVETALQILTDRLHNGEVSPAARTALQRKLVAGLKEAVSNEKYFVLSYFGDSEATSYLARVALRTLDSRQAEPGADELRKRAVTAWVVAQDPSIIEPLQELLRPSAGRSAAFRRHVLDSLTKSEIEAVAPRVLEIYPELEPELKPAAVELLTSRVAWSNTLLDAIGVGKLSKDAVNVNQIRKLLKTGDQRLAARVEQTWGALRTERNPQREQVVAQMRELLTKSPAGDPLNGRAVFTRLCGQCHKIHGQGQDVGPDITSNGRASLDQMLSNIFDPSLVIGNAYRARIVTTADGRVLTGLVVEESPQRLVFKLQGGKLETIPRSDIEEMEISKLSLMPEGVETQYKPEEIVDLFAFLKYDKPPDDPTAKILPGFGDLPAGNLPTGK